MERFDRPSLGSLLSDRLRQRAEQIAAEWLAHLLERLPEKPHDVFPDRELLNHVPELVERIAMSLSAQTDLEELLSADVLHELQLLAQLRRAQGYDLKELLIELEVLGEVVARHVIELMDRVRPPESTAEGARVARRLQRIVFAMGLVAADVFLNEGARQRLRRAEILTAFARAVQHELDHRVQPARVSLGLAREHVVAGRMEEGLGALSRAEASLQRLDALPLDLLGLSLSQARELSFPVRREPIARVLQRAVDGLSPYASVQGVSVSVDGSIPDLMVDAGRLQLVLVNLISNGIKYRDLDKAERWIRLSARSENGSVSVVVEDNGIGIPDDQLHRIFDDRFRVHSDHPYEGAGLGLALAQEALLQIGSRLTVESAVGRGTHFRFRLWPERVAAAPVRGKTPRRR